MSRRLLVLLAIVGALVSACGGTNVATNPAVGSVTTDTAAAATPTADTGPQTSGVRTVLSPLGLNVRASASPSGTRLGAASQGTPLTVLGYSADNGGWYHVQGATMTGWITADPTLSADGSFTAYDSSDRGFSALYPSSWTFAEETNDVVFRPQTGTTTIIVRIAASGTALGTMGATGYTADSDSPVVVCGVTGDLNTYVATTGASPTAISATAPMQPHYAQIRLGLDATHVMSIDFNYSSASELDTFATFYNSLTFPYPACEKPVAATPAPR